MERWVDWFFWNLFKLYSYVFRKGFTKRSSRTNFQLLLLLPYNRLWDVALCVAFSAMHHSAIRASREVMSKVLRG